MIKQQRCPNCRAWSNTKHCESPTCGWRKCKACKIVFDETGRSMKAKVA